MALTKKGIDVYDALANGNPNDFIFHSEFNTFKILAQATFSNLSVNSSNVTFETNHGLGIIPSVYGFAKFPDGYVAPAGERERADSTPPIERCWRIEVDSTKVYLYFNRGTTSNYTAHAKIYIFETPLP